MTPAWVALLPWKQIVIVLAVIGAGWAIRHHIHQQGYTDCEQANAAARAKDAQQWADEKRRLAEQQAASEKALNAYWVAELQKANKAAVQYQQTVARLELSARTFKERYDAHANAYPLPADCRFDDERLRLIGDAVSAANAAIATAQSSAGSPVHNDTDPRPEPP